MEKHFRAGAEWGPNDVVIRIFRSAPSELDALLSRLPQSLTGHAAIAKIPSLAGVCSPRQPGAVAGPDQGSCEGRTKFTLCAHINPAEHDVDSDEDELALAHDPSGCGGPTPRMTRSYRCQTLPFFERRSRWRVESTRLCAHCSPRSRAYRAQPSARPTSVACGLGQAT